MPRGRIAAARARPRLARARARLRRPRRATTRCWSSPTTRSIACCCAASSACRCRGCGRFRQAPTTLNLLEGPDVDHLDVVRLNDCTHHTRVVRRSGASGAVMPAHAHARRLAGVHRAPASASRSTWAWTACARSRARMGLGAAGEEGHHRRRHQRQGLDRRLHRSDRARRRLEGRRLHLAAPAAPTTSACASTARDADDADAGRRLRSGRSGARRHAADLFRIRHAVPRCGCSQRSRLDLAILEVGLGGRLDAVNIVDADVAVITTVDLDHQDWLGNDREAIGVEKAGIARAWKPLVLGEDDPPSSVLGHAYAIGASAIRANCDFFFEADRRRARGAGARSAIAIDLPMPALAAPVQLRNAATAIAALRALRQADADARRSRRASRGAHVAGRLQRFERDGVEIVVDVGHNPQAARELARVAAARAGRRAHARGVRRAGRQGRRRRGRGAGRRSRWLVPGRARRCRAARRWRSTAFAAAPARHARRPTAPRHADVAAALRGGARRRRRRAIASSCSVRSTPWPRRCSAALRRSGLTARAVDALRRV